MQKQHSKTTSSGAKAKAMHSDTQPLDMSGIGTAGYGSRPWDMSRVTVFNPQDTWLMYQAQSILGKPVTLEEAKTLFETIDPNTREPYKQGKPASLLDKLLHKLLN